MPSEIMHHTSASYPPAGHYSASCTANGMVYVSGQLPITFSGQKLSKAPFERQAQQVLDNLDACLAGAGTSREKLVQVRVYITDMTQWPAFNKIYADWIGDCRPARAVAGVSELHFGLAIEVEAVALAAG